jgi:hypothetical protein
MSILSLQRTLATVQFQAEATDQDGDDEDEETFWNDLPPQDRGVASVSSQDPPGNTIPSNSTSNITVTVAAVDLYALDAFSSAPWNRQSFIFGLLNGYLKLPDDFLKTLRALLHITDTSTFLEFFKAKPSSFLPRLPLQALKQYHDQFCQAWSIAKYFTRLHATEPFESFVSTYDVPYSQQVHQHCLVVRDIGRFLRQNQIIDQAEFQRAFDITTTLSNLFPGFQFESGTNCTHYSDTTCSGFVFPDFSNRGTVLAEQSVFKPTSLCSVWCDTGISKLLYSGCPQPGPRSGPFRFGS